MREAESPQEVSLHSEELFRSIVENVQDFAIFAIDLQGRIASWNPGVNRLLGYSEADFIGRLASVIFTEEDRSHGAPEQEMKTAADEGRAEDERWHVRRDNTMFWASGLMMPLHEPDGRLRGYAKVMRDCTERKHLEDVVQQRADELAGANRAKDEFLAILSHELRSPLTSILGWSHLLRTSKLDEPVVSRALETIERNAKLQRQLVDDLLDVSRIIAGKLSLDAKQVELTQSVESAIDVVRGAAETKGVQLAVSLDREVGHICGDAGRLQQIVWNLLSNAIKFTPGGGLVEIRLERADDPNARLTVKDTGCGINPEFLPHIFDRFRQADSTTTRAHGGLGLGLWIVHQLVKLHGGTIKAESDGEGRGATFTVELPLTAAASGASGSEKECAAAVASSAYAVRSMLDGIRVLVVDDEEDTRHFVQVALGRYGANVTAVGSAREALDALPTLLPDVLVSDIGMPGMDGYTLIDKIRVLPPECGGQTPAAALTAYARAEDRARVIAAGFQLHVPKPVDPSELATVIAHLAGRAGQQQGTQAAGSPGHPSGAAPLGTPTA